MGDTKNIALNEQEATALLQLIDVAVKAQGMSAAEAGLHLSKKIQEAFLVDKSKTESIKKT